MDDPPKAQEPTEQPDGNESTFNTQFSMYVPNVNSSKDPKEKGSGWGFGGFQNEGKVKVIENSSEGGSVVSEMGTPFLLNAPGVAKSNIFVRGVDDGRLSTGTPLPGNGTNVFYPAVPETAEIDVDLASKEKERAESSMSENLGQDLKKVETPEETGSPSPMNEGEQNEAEVVEIFEEQVDSPEDKTTPREEVGGDEDISADELFFGKNPEKDVPEPPRKETPVEVVVEEIHNPKEEEDVQAVPVVNEEEQNDIKREEMHNPEEEEDVQALPVVKEEDQNDMKQEEKNEVKSVPIPPPANVQEPRPTGVKEEVVNEVIEKISEYTTGRINALGRRIDALVAEEGVPVGEDELEDDLSESLRKINEVRASVADVVDRGANQGKSVKKEIFDSIRRERERTPKLEEQIQNLRKEIQKCEEEVFSVVGKETKRAEKRRMLEKTVAVMKRKFEGLVADKSRFEEQSRRRKQYVKAGLKGQLVENSQRVKVLDVELGKLGMRQEELGAEKRKAKEKVEKFTEILAQKNREYDEKQKEYIELHTRKEDALAKLKGRRARLRELRAETGDVENDISILEDRVQFIGDDDSSFVNVRNFQGKFKLGKREGDDKKIVNEDGMFGYSKETVLLVVFGLFLLVLAIFIFK